MPRYSATILIAMILVSACGPVPVYFTGNVDNNSFTFNGTGKLDLATHRGPYSLAIDDVGITCDGNFERTKMGDPLGVGEEYIGDGNCSDGRKATLAIRVNAVGSGDGTAADDCGNKYRVFFNMSQTPIAEKASELKSIAKAAIGPSDRCALSAPGAPPHRDPLS